MIEQAMRTLGFHGKTQETLSPQEMERLQIFLRTTMHGGQGQRQPGMGTPRMASGGNPMMPGGSQPGQPGPQGGMPGYATIVCCESYAVFTDKLVPL